MASNTDRNTDDSKPPLYSDQKRPISEIFSNLMSSQNGLNRNSSFDRDLILEQEQLATRIDEEGYIISAPDKKGKLGENPILHDILKSHGHHHKHKHNEYDHSDESGQYDSGDYYTDDESMMDDDEIGYTAEEIGAMAITILIPMLSKMVGRYIMMGYISSVLVNLKFGYNYRIMDYFLDNINAMSAKSKSFMNFLGLC